MKKPPLVVIAGPTASGKTSLSVECALRFGGEIISADSMQIYKGMNIATAKPTTDEMKGVPHHLIDFLSVDKTYSVAEFTESAKTETENITNRNNVPFVVGGTGLYIDSFVNNTQFIQTETDALLREKLTEKLNTVGAEKMLEELNSFDPDTAVKLHPSNKKRIIRAFEVYELTGKTFSQTVADSKGEPLPYNIKYIFINYRNRNILYERINRRVDIMIEQGLVNEAKKYFDLPDKVTASQAIGYKELRPYFMEEISLDEAVNNLKQATRHYAKRQITWFNKSQDTTKVYPDDFSSQQDFINNVCSLIEEVM